MARSRTLVLLRLAHRWIPNGLGRGCGQGLGGMELLLPPALRIQKQVQVLIDLSLE